MMKWHATFILCIAVLTSLGKADGQKAGERTPAPVFTRVEVSTDTALLKALKSPNATNIVLSRDIVLGEMFLVSCARFRRNFCPRYIPSGPSFAFLSPALILRRNVTIYGGKKGGKSGFKLDLAYYTGLIHLGTRVKLTFSDLLILHQKRQQPLYPGEHLSITACRAVVHA